MKTKFPKKWFTSLNYDSDYRIYNADSDLYMLKTNDISDQKEFLEIILSLRFILDSAYVVKYKYTSMQSDLNTDYFVKIKSNNDIEIIGNNNSNSTLLFKFIDNSGNVVYIVTDYISRFRFKFDYELFSKHFSSVVSIIKVDETTFKNTLALNNIIDDCKSIVDERKQAEIKQYRTDNNLCIKCGSEFALIGSAHSVESFDSFNYYRCKNDSCKHEFKRKQDENLS